MVIRGASWSGLLWLARSSQPVHSPAHAGTEPSQGQPELPIMRVTCPPVSYVTSARWLLVGISPCDWGVPAHTCQARTPACCPGLTPVGTGWPSQAEGALSKGAVSSLPVFKRRLGLNLPSSRSSRALLKSSESTCVCAAHLVYPLSIVGHWGCLLPHLL